MNHHSFNPIQFTRTVRALPLLAVLAGLWTLNPQLSASPLGTAFTYQGRLADGGNPASGIYDLRFTIYDALAGGNAIGGVLTNGATEVTNGLFTVVLDYGKVFTGQALWLEIGVRSNGAAADFTVLSPRQALTPATYALYAASAGTAASAASAASVAAANITGTIPLAKLPGAVLTNNATGVNLTAASRATARA
jgi:hypothetical protein